MTPLESITEMQPSCNRAVLRLSIVSFDRAFDDLGFLSNKLR